VWVEPVPAGTALLGGEDLDLIPRLQLIVQGYQAAIDLGATAAVPDLTVNQIGKVHRRGAGRQVDDVSLGRKDVYTLCKQVPLERGSKLQGIIGLRWQLSRLKHEVEPLLKPDVPGGALLVAPMRSNAILCHLVHGLGANLHFERAPLQSDDGGVQRLIAVILGQGDIVVKLASDGAPEAMDRAQRVIALALLLHDHADAKQIIDLVKGAIFLLHLAVNAVQVLGATGDAIVQALLIQASTHGGDGAFQVRHALRALLCHQAGDGVILLRLEVAKSQIFQLPFELPDAQAVRQRRKNVHGLTGHAQLPIRREIIQRAHVV